MSVVPVVNAPDLRNVLAVLREMDKQVGRKFANDMRKAIQPVMQDVRSAVPVEAPLSGFKHEGRLAWGPVTARVLVKPNTGRKGGFSPLVTIQVAGDGEAALKLVELAGIRGKYRDGAMSKPYSKVARGNNITHRINGQGRALVRVLRSRFPVKGKGGRFAYERFVKSRPRTIELAGVVLQKYADMVNRKLAG